MSINWKKTWWYFAVCWWCLGVVIFFNWSGVLGDENKFVHVVGGEKKSNWGFFSQFFAIGVLTPFLIAGLWKAAMKRRKEEKSPILENKEK